MASSLFTFPTCNSTDVTAVFPRISRKHDLWRQTENQCEMLMEYFASWGGGGGQMRTDVSPFDRHANL